MKKFGFWAVAAALLLAPLGFCSCSMGATTTSEMKGGLDYVQDDLREKPFKAIDVDVVASVYYTQNNGEAIKLNNAAFDWITLPSRMLSSQRNSRRNSKWFIVTAR